MTYNNAVKHINSLPTVSVGNSERIRNICAALGSPHKQLKTIQICGDIGKNSCSEMLSSILTESNHTVGLYSLSHVSELRERIKIGGKSIPHAEFADRVKSVFSLPPELIGDGQVSQNELIFIVSLMYFADCGCDAVIFERQLSRSDTAALDAPILTVITSVFDNMSPIPFEEVIHRGTRETVTCIQHKDIYSSISDACAEAGCRLTLPIYADLEVKKISLFKTVFIYRGLEYSIGAFSPCQLLNAITVIEAAHALARLDIDIKDSAVIRGLDRAHLPLLCQAISIEPTIIVATVSNEKHMEAFVASMAQVRDLITGKLDVFVSPSAVELTAGIAAKFASCSLECGAPSELSATDSSDFKTRIAEIIAPIAAGNDPNSTTVFIGDSEYIYELTQQIRKNLSNIL